MKKTVSTLGEKNLIKKIIEEFGTEYIGDDAAILDNKHNDLVFTSDMLIESHHLPKQMTKEEIGFKIVTVNISDIIAMGAKPIGFLLNIAIPKNMTIEDFNKLINGVKKGCQYYKVPLLGGDTNEAEEIILSGTAIGTTPKNKSTRKTTAKKGDLIGITGKIGLAALGFHTLNTKPKTKYTQYLQEKILKPKAKLTGEKIGQYANSLTDITDGLAEELYEMKNNKIGFKIYYNKIPIDEEYKKIVKELNLNIEELLFHFGEDFELVFTINKEELKNLKDTEYYIIGEVTDTGQVELVKDEDIKILPEKGYQHLN